MSAIHNNTQQCKWISLLTVCDSLVPLKVDSGAQVNILSLSDYEGLASKPKLLTERRPKLKTYNEENTKILKYALLQSTTWERNIDYNL